MLLDPLSRVRLKEKFQGFCVGIRTAVPLRLVIIQTMCKTVGTFVGLTAEVKGAGIWRGVCLHEYRGVYTGY